MSNVFEGKVLTWESVKTIQPTMNLRWLRKGHPDEDELQQQWVCMEDGATEWKRIEIVEEEE